MQTIIRQTINELAKGFTHAFKLTYADLTETTANTAQTIALCTLPAYSLVKDAAFYMPTAFQDASDSAFNTTAMIVGDSGDTDRFIASAELNVNGTEILAKGSSQSATPHAYATATAVNAIFSAMTGKALNDIDAGEIWIFLNVVDLSALTNPQ